MCQAFAGEQRWLIHSELRDIQKKWEAHKSGEKPLTKEELKKLAIQKLILEDT